jgi:hypothetical protein
MGKALAGLIVLRIVDMNELMRKELLRLMPVKSDGDWGPQPMMCRWCNCCLSYTDGPEGQRIEKHKPNCFAVTILGRPT